MNNRTTTDTTNSIPDRTDADGAASPWFRHPDYGIVALVDDLRRQGKLPSTAAIVEDWKLGKLVQSDLPEGTTVGDVLPSDGAGSPLDASINSYVTYKGRLFRKTEGGWTPARKRPHEPASTGASYGDLVKRDGVTWFWDFNQWNIYGMPPTYEGEDGAVTILNGDKWLNVDGRWYLDGGVPARPSRRHVWDEDAQRWVLFDASQEYFHDRVADRFVFRGVAEPRRSTDEFAPVLGGDNDSAISEGVEPVGPSGQFDLREFLPGRPTDLPGANSFDTWGEPAVRTDDLIVPPREQSVGTARDEGRPTGRIGSASSRRPHRGSPDDDPIDRRNRRRVPRRAMLVVTGVVALVTLFTAFFTPGWMTGNESTQGPDIVATGEPSTVTIDAPVSSSPPTSNSPVLSVAPSTAAPAPAGEATITPSSPPSTAAPAATTTTAPAITPLPGPLAGIEVVSPSTSIERSGDLVGEVDGAATDRHLQVRAGVVADVVLTQEDIDSLPRPLGTAVPGSYTIVTFGLAGQPLGDVVYRRAISYSSSDSVLPADGFPVDEGLGSRLPDLRWRLTFDVVAQTLEFDGPDASLLDGTLVSSGRLIRVVLIPNRALEDGQLYLDHMAFHPRGENVYRWSRLDR